MRRLLLKAGPVALDRGQLERTDGTLVRLTTKETELLAYLAERPGIDISREQLLTDVWGYAATVRTRALDTAVKELRRKIELDRKQPDHIITVWGHGYRFEPGLPPAPDALVGRAREFDDLQRMLARPGARVVVTGPGGVGKSRLTLEVLADRDPVFVALDDLHGPAALDAVARALPPSDRSLGARLAALERPLILDDAEHLAHTLPDLLAPLLSEAPQLTVAITSRIAIELPDSERLALAPLDRSDTAELLDRLLADLGTETDPSWRERLAARLDGLPLAAELVTSWAPVLGLDDLLARAEDLLHRPGEQPSMAEVTRRSLDLLAEGVRSTLTACACFPDGFEAPEVEALAEDDDTLRHLLVLRRASLVSTGPDGRLRLLPVIRRTVRDRLPAPVALRERFADLATAWGSTEEGDTTEAAQRWVPALEQCVRDTALPDPVRARSGVTLFGALPRGRGAMIDAAFGQTLVALTRSSDDPDLVADAAFIQCAIALRGSLPTTPALLDRAVASATRATSWRRLRALGIRATHARLGQRLDAALEDLQHATALQDTLPPHHHGALVWSELGLVHRASGRVTLALNALEQAQQLAERGGSDWTRAVVMHRRANTLLLVGHFEAARVGLLRARDVARKAGMPGLAISIEGSIANAVFALGDLEATEASLGRLEALDEPYFVVERHCGAALLHLERGAVPEASEAVGRAREQLHDEQGPMVGRVALVDGVCRVFARDPTARSALSRAVRSGVQDQQIIARIWLAAISSAPPPEVPEGHELLARLLRVLGAEGRGPPPPEGVHARLLHRWLALTHRDGPQA